MTENDMTTKLAEHCEHENCDQEVLCGLNGRSLCHAHFEEEMKGVGDTIRKANTLFSGIYPAAPTDRGEPKE